MSANHAMNHATLIEIAAALGVSRQAASQRAERESWPYQEHPVRGGRRRHYPVATLPKPVRDALVAHRLGLAVIRDADARQVAGTLTRDLVYPLIALNRPGINGLLRCPRWVFDTGSAEDLKTYSEALPKLAENGARIPVAWVHEKLRIPQAAGDEAVFGVPPSPTGRGARGEGTTPADGANKTALAALSGSVPADIPIEDQLAARLAGVAAPNIEAWLETIRAMLDQADSLEAFREMLVAAYPTIDRAGLVVAMSEAMAAGHLWGMGDVADEG
jgi:phage gp29-like protein